MSEITRVTGRSTGDPNTNGTQPPGDSAVPVTPQKAPSYQWYPGDHRRDASLLACSFEAKSIWRVMLDLMHSGEPYGHLTTANGIPITADELARMEGVRPARVRSWIAELEGKGVFSRTPGGIVYSRRMVRDKSIREKRAAGGPRSLDNPNVPRPKHARSPSESRVTGNTASAHGEADTLSARIPCAGSSSTSACTSAISDTEASSLAASEVLLSRLGARASNAVSDFLSELTPGAERARWIAEIEGWLEGLNLPSVATPDDIGAGLADYLLHPGRDWAPLHVRAFITRATKERTRTDPQVPARPRRQVARADAVSMNADSAFTAICRAKQSNGVRQFIPLAAVAELGPVALQAYNDVGGADRFIETTPDKLGWLRREFITRYQATINSQPTGEQPDASG